MNSAKLNLVKMKFSPKRDIPLYLLILPGFLIILVFAYIPMYGISLSFVDFNPYKGILSSPFVGLKHFVFFLSDPDFWKVFRNTVMTSLFMLIFAYPAPIILALALNEVKNIFFKRIAQTISYLPYFVSWVVVASIVISILAPETGLVNQMLTNVFGVESIYFLGKQEYFRSILVISAIWKDIGINSVYYMATLTGIDPQLYEAAKMDGATRFQQMRYITIPSLRYIAVILLLLQIGSVLNVSFEQVYLLSNPLVYNVGDVISTYTYRIGIENAQFSKTTAIGLTQSLFSFILVFSANKLSKKIAGWSMW